MATTSRTSPTRPSGMNAAVIARPSGVPRKGRFRSVGTGPGDAGSCLNDYLVVPIDPTGSYLFSANELSGTVTVFHVEGTSGRLTPTSTVLKIDVPACIKFVPVQR